MGLIVLNRQEFISQLQTIVSQYGFMREDERFIRSFTSQTPGQQILINNQVINQPGPIVDVKFIVDLWGTGTIMSEDSEIPFEQVCFMVYTKLNTEPEFDTRPDMEYCYGFQYDEAEHFTKLLSKIFRI